MVDNRKVVDLELSLNELDNATMSSVQKEFIQEELDGFDKIKENDVNISTSYVFDMNDKIEAKVFFRNGFSSKINFEKVPLLLLDENGDIVTGQIFNLRDLGDIPAHGVRPYQLFFDKSNMINRKAVSEGWKVIFNNNIKAINTVKVEYEKMPEDLDIEARIFFNKYLNSLPLLEKGQVEIKPYMVKLKEDNKVKFTIVIRNGADKKAILDEMPVTILDADKKVVYSSKFKVEDLEVNPLKAQLCNFLVDLSDKDLSEFNMENLSLEFK